MLFFFLCVCHIMKLPLISVKMVCAGSALSGNKFRVELNPVVYKNFDLVITCKDYVV